jgi:hypothetical protein
MEVTIMSRSPATKKPPRRRPAAQARLYTLKVFITSGPILDKFARKNPQISRTIAIRGDQTLEDLHEEIFDAFDREEEHMYEFLFGRGPTDRNALRYVLPMVADDGWSDPPAGVVDSTTIDSLGLKVKDRFWYWFDFGDDWKHRIEVKAVADPAPPGRYPAVVDRVGESPPQYIAWDSEEEEEDEEDEVDEPPKPPKKSGSRASKSKLRKKG